MDFKRIPIVILSCNRVSCLKSQLEAFAARGYTNIHVLDNGSTYPPLLQYYDLLPYEVIRLGQNSGYKALSALEVMQRFNQDYYACTDPDVVPAEECPEDFMEHLYGILQRYSGITKAGFSLKIDDLPDCYRYKQRVIEWESKYWDQKMALDVYSAPIDTTFALCRPGSPAGWSNAARSGVPYVARHTTWYLDSDHLPEDEEYYTRNLVGKTWWSKLNAPGSPQWTR